MCLVIINSWGKGWGVNGYSCMTLAWFNEYRFRQKNGNLYSTMFIHDVNLDEAYAKEKYGNSVSDELEEGNGNDKKGDEEKEGDVDIVVIDEKKDPDPVDPNDNKVEEEDQKKDDEPVVIQDGFTVGKLVREDGTMASVVFKVESDSFTLKGVHPDNKSVTKALVLRTGNNKIFFNDTINGRNDVEGGVINGTEITLCAKKYQGVCKFHIDLEENQLLIGLTEGEFENEPQTRIQVIRHYLIFRITVSNTIMVGD